MNRISKIAAATVAAITVSTSLTGCFPLLLGGAMVGGATVYTDRRTSGIQLEDEAIELKASNRLRSALGERAHVSVVSYNRLVLLTGEVSSEADRATVGRVVSDVDNVRSIVNEVALAGAQPSNTLAADALVTSKIKASLVDAKDIFAQSVKVVTEHGTVYLMGRVTEREANRATEIARGVSGVEKVVRVFEIITEAELATLQAPSPPPPRPER